MSPRPLTIEMMTKSRTDFWKDLGIATLASVAVFFMLRLLIR